ncbi:unnamed protein product [Urochloa humidicola]
MLRRAASTLNSHAAARLRRLPSRLATSPPPAQLGSHHHPGAHLQPRRGLPHLGLGGARGYRRMARRLPPERPDGYSTSEGELEEEPDEFEDITEPGEDGDDSEGSEVEGYMLDFSTFPDGDGDGDGGKKEEGADDEGGKK